jgi:uncharacterized protein (TIGR02270 family)
MESPVIPVVLDRHAEEAAFLWLLRSRAVGLPQFTLRQLAELDQRVEAHLDGLRVAGDFGWGLCLKGLEEGGPGELFAAAVLGFEDKAEDRTRAVIEKGPTAPPRVRAVASALGWLPYERVKGVIAKLAGPGPLPQRYAGLAAAAAHRRHPSFALGRALSGDPWFDARVYRAIGEFGATDSRRTVQQGLTAADEACRFWAAWSGVLVYGEAPAAAALQATAEAGGPFADAAARTAPRRMALLIAKYWVRQLAAGKPPRLRLAAVAAGAAGDPAFVPWLLEAMQSPPAARVAGEAFANITGVDLAAEHLDGPPVEGGDTGPTDNPADENVTPDADLELPWPDPKLVATWWAANKARFPAGTRHLLGKPITPDWLQHVLAAGRQSQRAAAAFEISLLKAGTPLFEIRAPGFRQQALLAAK